MSEPQASAVTDISEVKRPRSSYQLRLAVNKELYYTE